MFLSHTSELRRYPARESSYVSLAQQAVSRTEHVVVNMENFGAEDCNPAQVCEREVAGSDVYVGLIGCCYGSPVRDRFEVSYTELEFAIATREGIPRLLFLLDTSGDHKIPPIDLYGQHGPRQEVFRQRLREDSELTVDFFQNPDDLARRLESSLRKLADRLRDGTGPDPSVESSNADPDCRRLQARLERAKDFLSFLPDRDDQDLVMSAAFRKWMEDAHPLPMVVLLHGESKQAVSRYAERFCEYTAPRLLKSKTGHVPRIDHVKFSVFLHGLEAVCKEKRRAVQWDAMRC